MIDYSAPSPPPPLSQALYAAQFDRTALTPPPPPPPHAVQELCRTAAMLPMREMFAALAAGSKAPGESLFKQRAVCPRLVWGGGRLGGLGYIDAWLRQGWRQWVTRDPRFAGGEGGGSRGRYVGLKR